MVRITEDGPQAREIGRDRVPAAGQTHEYSAVTWNKLHAFYRRAYLQGIKR
jgi:hypothetical protein